MATAQQSLSRSDVQVTRPAAGVAVVRLDAPERKNALVGDMARALTAALEEVDSDERVGAVVLTGAGGAFCAGAHRDLLAAARGPEGEDDLDAVYAAIAAVRELRAPSLAAVAGPAVGAGLNLALACGVRLLASDAYLRSMFVANSIHPAGGHLAMLSEIGGRSLAVRMAVLDQPLDAAAAVAAGLGLGPYDPDEVEAEAVAMAATAAGVPALARSINRSVDATAGLNRAEAARAEADLQLQTLREPGRGT